MPQFSNRKRKATPATYKSAPFKKPRMQPMPGRERVSGFYGRFSGANAEQKFFDTALGFFFDTTAEVPTSGQLALIPQGVTESTRVGRKATVRSIQIRGQVTASTAAIGDYAVMSLVLDTQCNGAAAAITDVMTSASLDSAMINLANSGRFKILRTFRLKVAPTASAANGINQYSPGLAAVEFYKKVNIPIEYSSTTGAITEIRSNNIFLIAGSYRSTDDLLSFSGKCRLRYSDQ